jgi:biotin/methionine sulfoxide reductase
LISAWRRPETIVVHEQYWNPLARYADIVLPASTTLERNDFAVANRENLVVAMKRIIDPVGEARSDFEILRELARRLNVREAFDEGRDEMAWVEAIYESCRSAAEKQSIAMPDFDEFWRAGHVLVERNICSSTMLADFRRDASRFPLKTPSGRIELFSDTIASFGYDDCVGHPSWYEPIEWLGSKSSHRFPIHLLSCQPRSKLHSQYDHGAESLREKVAGRAPIRISPDDANRRGITPFDIVRVFNERGACLAGAVIDHEMKPGIAMLATGAWYDPVDPAKQGSLDKHGNPNVLTPDRGSSRLTQAPIPNSTLVEIELYREEAPLVSAFTPPAFVVRPQK